MKYGKMLFEMKWKNGAPNSLVYAAEAKERYPQIVIQFYETNWHQARSMSKQNKNQKPTTEPMAKRTKTHENTIT